MPEQIDPRTSGDRSFDAEYIREITLGEIAIFVIKVAAVALVCTLVWGFYANSTFVDRSLTALITFTSLILGWYFGQPEKAGE